MSNTKALSSITKKVIMSLAGLFLIVFLLIHLGINLFLLPIVEGNREVFHAAAEFMSTFWPMKVMEIALFGGFILHGLYGVIVQLGNWKSRGSEAYKVSSKTKTTFASRTMIYSGLLVLLFLVMHLYQFYFVKLGLVEGAMLANGHPDFYTIAVNLFTNDMIFSSIYILLFVVLGFHLYHAFQSAFQTMGWNHPKYTPVVKVIGNIYAVVVPLGFIIIPLYYMFMG
ncbi:succinate dehydrogenase cytochrome b subunit [Lentimicrobium sp. S6]|uniref:succinate dehydrogenase cytochrome b subunit n=1 Tax=Lentimicrobium sp. S6 TaxID=2735872 RepID=UPI001557D65F|nr:succinate dehydrogenase cytochrome b subunit [Lentimicrobium sp. S6]NPD45802.1 succinate dehydrogenase cytochrome b subunit [Lentimicrobium sp. S6]